MTCSNPTQLVMEHLTRDRATLHDPQRRLTLADAPTDVRDRIIYAIRRPDARPYCAIRNERVVYTHAHLGALRRMLVQWAAQHAPAAVGGFHGLLAWSLVQVEWREVVRCVTRAAEEDARADNRTLHRAAFGQHTAMPTA